MNPMQFMIEGGFGMWPVLVFGLVALGAATRYAWKPERPRLGFVVGMVLTVVSATIHATWTDVGAVFRYLESRDRASDADFWRIFMEGMKESTRPGALAGIFVTLALLAISVGLHRESRREARG